MSRDTSPPQERRYFELLAALPPAARLHRAISLSRTVRKLAMAGLRTRHPDAGERELRARLAAALYGSAVARRIFGELPGNAR